MKNAFSSAVYVMVTDESGVKIGKSVDPEKRRATIERFGPRVVRLVYATDVRDDASFIEAEVHRMLADKRRLGEWFDVTPDEAITAIQEAIPIIGQRKYLALCKNCAPGPIQWPKKRRGRPLSASAYTVRVARKRGRPPKYGVKMTEPVGVRLEEQVLVAIEQMARANGTDYGEVMRSLLKSALEQRGFDLTSR